MCASNTTIKAEKIHLESLRDISFLHSLYFSAVRSTVQLNLGTAGMRNS